MHVLRSHLTRARTRPSRDQQRRSSATLEKHLLSHQSRADLPRWPRRQATKTNRQSGHASRDLVLVSPHRANSSGAMAPKQRSRQQEYSGVRHSPKTLCGRRRDLDIRPYTATPTTIRTGKRSVTSFAHDASERRGDFGRLSSKGLGKASTLKRWAQHGIEPRTSCTRACEVLNAAAKA